MEMEKKSETKKRETVKSGEEKKISYEQLEKIANDLMHQRNQMYEKLQEAQGVIADFNEVGMLLSIIERGENFDSSFIDRCASKVQEVVSEMLDKADDIQKSKKEN